MEWIFYLDDLEIEEPIGFDDIELSVKRDDKLHGMTFEASTSPLEFYGNAYNYLIDQYNNYGVKANVTFSAHAACDGYDYEEVISGRLNFGKKKEKCGSVCTISIPWEQDSCELVLKARYDQKVDMDKALGVNGTTALPAYAGLATEKTLPAHELKASVEGYVVDEGDVVDLDIYPPVTNSIYIRPTYGRPIYESINISQLFPSVFAASFNGVSDSALSPVLLLDDSVSCFGGDFDYEVRLKGSYDYEYAPGGTLTDVRLIVAIGFPFEAGAVENVDYVIIHQQALPHATRTATGTFDYTYSGATVINQGEGFYAYFQSILSGIPILLGGTVSFDKETYANISGVKACPPTQSELYLVHEALSRVTEAVTNGCMRAKSSYYGRTDSEPFSFDADGCGGLRSITSGLKIRNAEEDKFFASPKDLIEGLNAIDNIGIGVEDDPDIPNKSLLVIEDLNYFYRDEEILRHDFIPEASADVEETKHYSKIEVGYKKWEVESINGLDEIHSNRQYNTSIDTINSTLDITSNLVAGSYPIEITRQQSFSQSGAADTKYDNETFIICMVRTGYLYGSVEPDLGNISSAENIFSPSTIYNYPISPIRNLMRWYKSIAAGFPVLSNSSNKLFFLSGTGNLQAKGMLTGADCRLENTPLRESQDLFVTQFANAADYQPLWKNDLMTYEYPMSLAEYKQTKANPYGYISSQCGSGEFVKNWIKEIKYKLAKGSATFILRKKY